MVTRPHAVGGVGDWYGRRYDPRRHHGVQARRALNWIAAHIRIARKIADDGAVAAEGPDVSSCHMPLRALTSADAVRAFPTVVAPAERAYPTAVTAETARLTDAAPNNEDGAVAAEGSDVSCHTPQRALTSAHAVRAFPTAVAPAVRAYPTADTADNARETVTKEDPATLLPTPDSEMDEPLAEYVPYESARPHIGDKVVLHSLVRQRELNGRIGRVLAEAQGRWRVQLAPQILFGKVFSASTTVRAATTNMRAASDEEVQLWMPD